MKRNLTEGPVGPHLIRLTLPMVWGVFAIVAFNLADTYFVGQLGTQYLAAMSLTFPVVLTVGSMAMGLGIGAASVIARAIGEGDHSRVQRFTTNSLLLSVLAVLIVCPLGLATIDPLFRLLGATEAILPLVHEYMQIWYFGMVFLVVPMVGNNAIRAAGNTLTPSLIMTLAALLNIILDPLLILGVGGLPRLELQGAALATLIARATTLIAALAVLHWRERMLSLKVPSFQEMIWCWKDILHVGLPAAATNMITPMTIGVITSLLSAYGAVAIAAFGIASRVESFAMIALLALSASLGPFVGQNWGAKQFARVGQALQMSFVFCLVWGLGIAAILAVGAGPVSAVFDANPEVVATASRYLWIVPVSYAAAGAILMASAAANALGKPAPALTMTLVRTFGLHIPVAVLASKVWGIEGIFAAACVSNLVVGAGAYFWGQQTCSMKAARAAVQVSLPDPLEGEVLLANPDRFDC